MIWRSILVIGGLALFMSVKSLAEMSSKKGLMLN